MAHMLNCLVLICRMYRLGLKNLIQTSSLLNLRRLGKVMRMIGKSLKSSIAQVLLSFRFLCHFFVWRYDMQLCLHPIRLNSTGMYVPCGKCPACRSRSRYDLSTRIYLESAFAGSAFFITLTYSEDSLPLSKEGKPCFDKKQVQDFLKRFRQNIVPTRLRFFLTCEYGDGKEAQKYLQQYGTEFGRPHYHAIFILDSRRTLREVRDMLQKAWPFGFTQIASCNMARIQYASQYALKDESYLYKPYKEGDPCKPFRLFSLRPGLGSGFGESEKPIIAWLNEYVFNDGIHIRGRIKIAGKERGIPRYWKDRLDPSVSEELRQKGLQWLEDNQDQMAETQLKNSVRDGNGYRIGNDYTIDNQILAKRRAIRQIRKIKGNSL